MWLGMAGILLAEGTPRSRGLVSLISISPSAGRAYLPPPPEATQYSKYSLYRAVYSKWDGGLNRALSVLGCLGVFLAEILVENPLGAKVTSDFLGDLKDLTR